MHIILQTSPKADCVDKTLHNGVKAQVAGGLREITGKVVSAEQMEIARLKVERDILKKATVYFARVAVRCAFCERD